MRYYGNKTKLLDFISDTARELDTSKDKTFFDLFTGTTSVAMHFKKAGYKVIANDWLFFSYCLATSNIKINSAPDFKKLKEVLKDINSNIFEYLNNIEPNADFITTNYTPFKSNTRQYFTVDNGMKIDAIRIKINDWLTSKLITESESCYLITSLINAVNKVSNVSGTYGSFLKSWDNRAYKKLTLQEPEIIFSDKNNLSFNQDAEQVVDKFDVDILYLDPPYNSRQYASNYFLLELIAEGWFGNSLPEIYGYTGMRPYEHQKSPFSTKKDAKNALERLINKAKAKYIMLSYNNEGIIPSNEVLEILSAKGDVVVKTYNHKRYRSIGQDGSNIKTTEYLYVVKTKVI